LASNAPPALADFLAIARDARGSGARIFTQWLADPGKYLAADALPIDKLLRELPPQEIDRVAKILDFFTGMSFYYLFKYLEEGEGPFSFELKMSKDGTPGAATLIGKGVDLEIREHLAD
jgi:hypothetical protein